AAVAARGVRRDPHARFSAGDAGDDLVHDGDIRRLRRDLEDRGVLLARARPHDDVDGVVVDHDGRDHEARAAVALALGVEARIDDDPALDPLDPVGRHSGCELAYDRERVALEALAVRPAVTVIDVLERERISGPDP